MPRFSIVVPAYNAESTLADTLDAIAAQNWSEWECVIVDDGSTDATPDVAGFYVSGDTRFTLHRQENQGTAGAYNTGVLASTAELIVICSADDLLLPSHLLTMAELADRNPTCGIYSSNGDYLLESGERRQVYEGLDWECERSLTLEDVLACCFFSVGAVYRRSVFDLVGGYRVGVYGEDYDFWLRAMAKGATHRYSPQVLATHRLSGMQKSSDVLRVWRSNIEAYANLIEGGWVSADQRPVVCAAIESRGRLVRAYERRQSLVGRLEVLSERFTPMLGHDSVRRLRRFGGAVLRRLGF